MAIRVPLDPAPLGGADGRYPIEVVHDGWRVCAASPDEVVGLIVDSYSDLRNEAARGQARLELALRARREVQTALNAGEPFTQCTAQQQQVLLDQHDAPPVVKVWDAVVPLVLVSVFYQPAGELAPPQVRGLGQVWWIDPSSARSLLETLHQVRWLDLVTDDAGTGAASVYGNRGPNGAAGYWWRSLPA